MIENLNAWAGKIFLLAILVGGAYYGVDKLMEYRPLTQAELDARARDPNSYQSAMIRDQNRRLAEIQRHIDENMEQNANMVNEIMGHN